MDERMVRRIMRTLRGPCGASWTMTTEAGDTDYRCVRWRRHRGNCWFELFVWPSRVRVIDSDGRAGRWSAWGRASSAWRPRPVGVTAAYVVVWLVGLLMVGFWLWAIVAFLLDGTYWASALLCWVPVAVWAFITVENDR